MAEQTIEATVSQAADKLIGAIEKYGPQAVEFSKEVGRIAAFQDIATGLSCLFVAFVIWKMAASPLTKSFQAVAKKNNYSDDGGVIQALGAGISWLAAAGFVIGASTHLFQIFAWVGMWHPEMYLAAKLLKLN